MYPCVGLRIAVFDGTANMIVDILSASFNVASAPYEMKFGMFKNYLKEKGCVNTELTRTFNYN